METEYKHKTVIFYQMILASGISVLQIRDFQLVGQRAEGVKGILRLQLVQESCIFLLSRNTKNGEN